MATAAEDAVFGDPTSMNDPTKKKLAPVGGNGQPIQPQMPGGFTGDMGQVSQASAPANVGHDGTYNGMNREQWRDAWMSSGKMSQDEMTNKLLSMGATNAGRGDYWTTPFGETYDLGMGYKTGNPTAAWTPVSGPSGSGSVGSGAGGGGGTGGGGMGSDGWSSDPGTNDFMGMLWSRAKQGLAVDRNDPIIANARDAYSASQERSMRNHLADLAERGGGTANLDLERRMGAENVGQNTAQYESQLMLGEVAARRQEIQNALSQMGQYMTEQQRMALQQRLADMDNLLARDTLGQRAFEFDTNTNARYQGF